jgi:peptidoglycan/LPS O-acetylase OafA/YrhL
MEKNNERLYYLDWIKIIIIFFVIIYHINMVFIYIPSLSNEYFKQNKSFI